MVDSRGPSSSTPALTAEDMNEAVQTATRKGWRYWTIIAALSVVALLPALEGTVVSTALPTVIQDLEGGKLYVWVVNAYFLTRYFLCFFHRSMDCWAFGS